MSSRYVWVEDRIGSRLPYSKGIMAASLMATGLTPEQAYRLAEAIELEVLAGAAGTISTEELIDLAKKVLEQQAGTRVADRYIAWRKAKRSPRPLVLLIGGAPGVGKSTISTILAGRIGFTRIIPTDAVREVMRNVFTRSMMPTLYVSSFEAYRAIRAPVPDDHDPVIAGFREQAQAISQGLIGLVDRAVTEATDLIVEGVHAIPGLLMEPIEDWSSRAVVAQLVLTVGDRDVHRAHFMVRGGEGESRSARRYLEHFEEIRRMQRYISRLAATHGVPEVESRGLDETVQDVLEIVGGQFTESQT